MAIDLHYHYTTLTSKSQKLETMTMHYTTIHPQNSTDHEQRNILSEVHGSSWIICDTSLDSHNAIS
jgi:hypothetical protein